METVSIHLFTVFLSPKFNHLFRKATTYKARSGAQKEKVIQSTTFLGLLFVFRRTYESNPEFVRYFLHLNRGRGTFPLHPIENGCVRNAQTSGDTFLCHALALQIVSEGGGEKVRLRFHVIFYKKLIGQENSFLFCDFLHDSRRTPLPIVRLAHPNDLAKED